MKKLHATETGRQVAFSGLLPETAHYLLQYLADQGSALREMIPDGERSTGDISRLDYCLINASLTSPEFSSRQRTRIIHHGFGEATQNDLVEAYADTLAEQPWQAYRSAANSSSLLMHWLDGVPVNLLEDQFPNVRAGSIMGLCRDLTWVLSGLSNILAAASNPSQSKGERPQAFRLLSPQALTDLRLLISPIRQLQWRLDVGLPTAALWMTELRAESGERAISRVEAIALHKMGLGTFESLRLRSNWHQLVDTLKALDAHNANDKAIEFQRLANAWHDTVRQRRLAQQLTRLSDEDKPLIEGFYNHREKGFESAFEALLERAGIAYELFDTGQKPGAFDYILHFDGRPSIVVECKTKQGNNLVDLNAARVVLSSSEQFGHQDLFCVTLCQPGIDPNVPEQLQSCARLGVVETHDLAEAFVRLLRRTMDAHALYDWLSQPGQIKAETLFVHTRAAAEPEAP
ncbi:hypothetical protein [Myxococcus hansupus]|uniref:hypothetical protein n=1 Tax=Pseudomyxococcus hansupus TaxID=1297742 RepID=UPI0005D10D12|nr:hypothetical protein [Myxococcus hansupus]